MRDQRARWLSWRWWGIGNAAATGQAEWAAAGRDTQVQDRGLRDDSSCLSRRRLCKIDGWSPAAIHRQLRDTRELTSSLSCCILLLSNHSTNQKGRPTTMRHQAAQHRNFHLFVGRRPLRYGRALLSIGAFVTFLQLRATPCARRSPLSLCPSL